MNSKSDKNNEIRISESITSNNKFMNKIVEGKRRKLLRKFLSIQALKKIISDTTNNSVINGPYLSEYISRYDKLSFTPITENYDILEHHQTKFPLYGSSSGSMMNTIYTEKIMENCVKRHSVMSNFCKPFRKNCNFTTPVEDRLRE